MYCKKSQTRTSIGYTERNISNLLSIASASAGSASASVCNSPPTAPACPNKPR